MARHRKSYSRRTSTRGAGGISHWLLRNWWLLAGAIVLFGALAWVDPPLPESLDPLGKIQGDVRGAALDPRKTRPQLRV